MRSARVVTAALALVALGPTSVVGSVDEPAVKGAFFFNAMQFVEWPASTLPEGAPIVACVFDDDALVQRFGGSSPPRVRGHELRVRAVAVPGDVEGCHSLWVPSASTARVGELAVRYKATGLLIVTEVDDTARVPSTMNVGFHENRLVFDVRLDVAQAQGLTVSSRLLKLARRVLGAEAVRGSRP